MAGYRLISSDRHVSMPDGAWPEYLDPEFGDRAPVIEEPPDGVFRVFEGTRSRVNTLNNLAGAAAGRGKAGRCSRRSPGPRCRFGRGIMTVANCCEVRTPTRTKIRDPR
jgi:hypothetical protein